MKKGLVRSPLLVLLFGYISCGIYNFYWIFKTSQETQEYLENTSATSPAVELLLCIFTCGIYYIYWNYKYAKVVAECHKKAGLPVEDNSVLCLILSICCLGVVSALILQTSLNKVWEAKN